MLGGGATELSRVATFWACRSCDFFATKILADRWTSDGALLILDTVLMMNSIKNLF